MFVPTTKKALFERWLQRLRLLEECHYESAKPLANLNMGFGIPVVILTTIVGTTVFATLEKSVEPPTKIIVALVSVTAAVLSSLQTFLRFSSKAESHRLMAGKAGALRRELEQILVYEDPNSIAPDRITAIREKIDGLASGETAIPARIFERVKKNIHPIPA